MAAGEVKVEGLRELQRAFQAADKERARAFREDLADVAEPVRVRAELLASQDIRKMTVPWSHMRIGVTTSSVYVAPQQRGTRDPRKKRPNFGLLLLGRSLEPALAQKSSEVEAGFNDLLELVEKVWATTP